MKYALERVIPSQLRNTTGVEYARVDIFDQIDNARICRAILRSIEPGAAFNIRPIEDRTEKDRG